MVSIKVYTTVVTESTSVSLNCGDGGLSNVGKSTLFSALTKAGIAADNYPPRLNDLTDVKATTVSSISYKIGDWYKTKNLLIEPPTDKAFLVWPFVLSAIFYLMG